MTFAAPLALANPDPGVWTVTGSPGDSVLLGLDALFADDPPDLGVPAIAVSIDGNAAQSVAKKDEVARYTGDLVETLARGRGPVLPDGLGLNVNYPGAQPAKGPKLTRQDPRGYFDIGYANTTGQPGEPGVYRVAPGAPSASPARGSDWDALGRGYVSITPIDADRTANPGFGGFGFLGGRW